MPAASWLAERQGRPWSFVKFSRAAYGAKGKCFKAVVSPPGFSSPPPSPSCSLFTAAHLAAPLPGRRSPRRRPCPRVTSPPSLAEGEKQKLLGSTNSFHFLPRFLLAAERLRCCLGLASWGTPRVHQNARLSHLLFPKGCDLTVGIVQQS